MCKFALHSQMQSICKAIDGDFQVACDIRSQFRSLPDVSSCSVSFPLAYYPTGGKALQATALANYNTAHHVSDFWACIEFGISIFMLTHAVPVCTWRCKKDSVILS